MKKVVVLVSSPRKKGNSTILANKIIEGIEAAGGELEIFYLNDMSIGPCQACGYCMQGETHECIFEDDMQEIYPKLEAADAFVLASPIYMFSYSAQLKLFLDRCEASLKAFEGKRIAIALTYANKDEKASGVVNAINSFKDLFSYTGSQIVGILHGSADKEDEISSNENLLDRAYSLGKTLVE
jgi:multimeric flavodoxin WrbA